MSGNGKIHLIGRRPLITGAMALMASTALTSPARAAQCDAKDPAWHVIDARTGRDIPGLSQNGDVVHLTASTTKLMTGGITFEAIKRGEVSLSEKFTYGAASYTSHQAPVLSEGTVKTVEEWLLWNGIMSHNAASIVLARGVAQSSFGGNKGSGDADLFIDQMNAKVKKLGLKKTKFFDPNGLTDKNFSTPREMCLVMHWLMANHRAETLKFFGQEGHKYGPKKGEYMRNHFGIVQQNGIKAAKSGLTTAAGRCGVFYAEASDGRAIIGTTLHVESGPYGSRNVHRDKLTRQLIKQAFG